MLVYGITYITLSISCSTACLSANASEAIVLPPPVGTVRRKIPFSSFPFCIHFFNISVLLPFTESNVTFFVHPFCIIYFSILFKSTVIVSPCILCTFPQFIKLSVSKKSASTKQEYIIRINTLNE